jgi:hypothetical protein
MSIASAITHLRLVFARTYPVILCLSFSTLYGCKEQGFICGVTLDNQADAVTRCTRNLEVCICETNLCARQVRLADCPSGLKYVEQPLVPASLADQCVSGLLHPNWTVQYDSAGKQIMLCSAVSKDGSVNQDMAISSSTDGAAVDADLKD